MYRGADILSLLGANLALRRNEHEPVIRGSFALIVAAALTVVASIILGVSEQGAFIFILWTYIPLTVIPRIGAALLACFDRAMQNERRAVAPGAGNAINAGGSPSYPMPGMTPAGVGFAAQAASFAVQPPPTQPAYPPVRGAPTEGLVKRAFLFLGDGDFYQVARYLEQALSQDPQNGRAFLGKLMVELGLHTEDELANVPTPLDGHPLFQRALQFGPPEQQARLSALAQAWRERAQAAAQTIQQPEQQAMSAPSEPLSPEDETERRYAAALAALNAAVTEKDYTDAARMFDFLMTYKDARMQAWNARKGAKAVREKAKKQKLIVMGVAGAVALVVLGFSVKAYLNHRREAAMARYEERQRARTGGTLPVAQNLTYEEFEEARKSGSAQAIRELLERKKLSPNVSVRIDSAPGIRVQGSTPLLILAVMRRLAFETGFPIPEPPSPEIVEELLRLGADVNARDEKGETALIAIVGVDSFFESQKEKIISILLKAGADVNARRQDGTTPLIAAADHLDLSSGSGVIEMLLRAGADINAKANDGSTALTRALRSPLMNEKRVEVLLKAGADLKAADLNAKTGSYGGGTLLMAVSQEGALKYVDMLLKAGADVNAKDDQGRTALIYAAGSLKANKTDIIDILDLFSNIAKRVRKYYPWRYE